MWHLGKQTNRAFAINGLGAFVLLSGKGKDVQSSRHCVSAILVHPGSFFPWRQMNKSLACQEPVLGKLVQAEALGRGLDICKAKQSKAKDLVYRGWKNQLTQAQSLGCIISCKCENSPGAPVKYPTTRKKGWLYVC